MQAPYETPPSSPRAVEERRIRTAASGSIFAPARPGTAFAETRERLIQESIIPPSPQPGN